MSGFDTSNAGPLALVGGGEWTDGCTFDSELLTTVAASEVVVLPTGSAYEYPEHLVDQAEAWFAGLGGTARGLPVLTRRDAYLPELVEAVRSARFIYLAGSSPMHLRSVLKDTPVFDALVSAWLAGAVLAGTAAGADVLCDPMVDTRGGAFTVGLGVVQGVAVIPRFEQWSPDKVHRTVTLAPSDLFVVGIDSSTALLRTADGTWRAEGVGNVVVYRGGSVVTLDDMQP
jgi:cyanophycinase